MLGYVKSPGKGDVDELLHGVADRLLARGLSPVGVVQFNSERCGEGPCDMDVRVLPDGPVIRISQSLGAEARGCRLDPVALESAVALVDASLTHDADCLIINKFGKHEASGRGFRPVIARAIEFEIPVLVGLNGLNEDAFQSFTGGMAIKVPASVTHLERWVVDAMSGSTLATA